VNRARGRTGPFPLCGRCSDLPDDSTSEATSATRNARMKRPHSPAPRTEPSASRRARRAGFTLVEVMVTMVVLVFGIGAVVTTLVMTTSLGKTNRESNIAATAARGAVEAMKATEFEEIFARFNANPADDPDGPGTAVGNTFMVPGLNVDPTDPDGIQGEILFVGNGVQLREDVVDVELGMPRDLNKDAVIDALDHKDDYWVLPVRVRVAWTGETGSTSLEYSTVLTR